MPRKKISEYRSKKLVNEALGYEYNGWQILDIKDTKEVYGYRRYVVKVDQAIKGRYKKGLVLLNVEQSEVASAVRALFDKGYSSLIVEPEVEHVVNEERYLSLSRQRGGIVLTYSKSGGVDVEQHTENLRSVILTKDLFDDIAHQVEISADILKNIYELFNNMFISFLEINPYIVYEDKLIFLDVAIEVDSSAELLVDGWTEGDVRVKRLTPEELVIHKLNKDSSASFSLEVINENGSIFLLLSGGGASVVIADEIYTLGSGGELANYGEYSGNPSEHETYTYTQQIMSLILKSDAKKKVLFIGGAVANFTNIAATFNGIIDVLEDNANELSEQSIKVYVRRGGPHQAIGLKNIEIALKKLGIYGGVYDPTKSIPDAVNNLLEGLS